MYSFLLLEAIYWSLSMLIMYKLEQFCILMFMNLQYPVFLIMVTSWIIASLE